jgi:hypothetical protein
MSYRVSQQTKTPFLNYEWSFGCLKAFLPPIRQKMGGRFIFGDFLFINTSINKYDSSCQEKNEKTYIKNKRLY